MLDASGKSPVVQVADLVKFMATQGMNDWASNKDCTAASATFIGYDGSAPTGKSASDLRPSSGVAPGAAFYDVRVLDHQGVGDISKLLSGIVLVAAAGKVGKNAAGQAVSGSVGSPGHQASVITVGAVEGRDTAALSDDSVAGFSSLGPTLGSGLVLSEGFVLSQSSNDPLGKAGAGLLGTP